MKHAAVPFKAEWKERRLGVVMFLDMVGYSAHMSRSEKQAMARVAHLERILRKTVPAYAGTLVKFLGDGTMAEFHTAVTAVACSLAILETIREHNQASDASERYDVRIGLHLGDIVEKNHDLFGDTVNVAARIQPYADPGGLAMSSNVYLSVRNQIPLTGASLGRVRLKNISEKVRIFLVLPPHLAYLPWIAKRRNPINSKLRGLVTALVVLALWGAAWMAHRPTAPRAALLYVRPAPAGTQQGTEAAARVADEIVDELNAHGGEITGWQWKDRAWVLDQLGRAGATDPANPAEGERLTAEVARRADLKYLVGVRLEDGGMGNILLSAKIVDGTTMAVIWNYSVKSDKPSRLTESMVDQLQIWAKSSLAPAGKAGKKKPRR